MMISRSVVPCVLMMVLYAQSTLATPPNIVLVMADDLGFSDLQSYGSEISTPNIDRLASEGLRFSNYHTAPSCAPTRAMLLTGVDSHRAGVGNIAEAIPPEQTGLPNYRGTLNNRVVTVATLLRDAGYHTYLTGKWHLGYETPELRPINRGFERTLMMPYSGADNWQQRPYLPNYKEALWFEDGEQITLPEDFYSSKYLIDKAIEFVDSNRGDGKPFFSYIPFQAVHIPVQAPKQFTEKYLTTYQQGWTRLRNARQQAAKELGLIPQHAEMITMNTTRDWQQLSVEEQQYKSKSMAVYAGMVDAMDHHLGRFIQHLKDVGEYDNTLFIFTSDNGAEASDPPEVSRFFSLWLAMVGYDTDYETLGERGSYNYIGPGFASAAASPLGYYKFYSGEGGMRVPLIISGPMLGAPRKGGISSALAYVKDIMPTILQAAGVVHPGSSYQGRTIETMSGKSLWPVLAGDAERVHDDSEEIAYEIGGNAALIRGEYKIMLNRAPVGDNRWHLYNIVQDPGETTDLAEQQPELFASLRQGYDSYADKNGILAMPVGYDQRKQVLQNYLRATYFEPVQAFFSSIIQTISNFFSWVFS